MNAFEFGQLAGEKIAAGPKGVAGMLTGLLQTPGQAGQKAMLAARRELKPISTSSAPPKTLLNPNPTESYNRTFDALKRQGIDQDTAAFQAEQAGKMYVPRRDALQSVGEAAARAQLMRQGKALGVGALGSAGIAGAYGRGPFALPQHTPEYIEKARQEALANPGSLHVDDRWLTDEEINRGMTKTQSARAFGEKAALNIEPRAPRQPIK